MLNIANRYFEPADENGIITVDLGSEGFGAKATLDPSTHKIAIQPSETMTEEQKKAWEEKAQNIGYFDGLARKKLMEINQATETKSTELFEREQRIKQAENEMQERQRKLDLALENLGKMNQPSNSDVVQPLHEFLGIAKDELPNYIANNPEFSGKLGEYVVKASKTTSKNDLQTFQATQQTEAIRQAATTDGLDFNDFINNFCTPGQAQPNMFNYNTYKTLKRGSGGQPSVQQQLYDLAKYTTEVMPIGSHALNYDNITQDMVDKMTPAERETYRQFCERTGK